MNISTELNTQLAVRLQIAEQSTELLNLRVVTNGWHTKPQASREARCELVAENMIRVPLIILMC
jgi:hypothetical protein